VRGRKGVGGRRPDERGEERLGGRGWEQEEDGNRRRIGTGGGGWEQEENGNRRRMRTGGGGRNKMAIARLRRGRWVH